LGFSGKSSCSNDRSCKFGSSLEEGDQRQEDTLGFSEGSYNFSFIQNKKTKEMLYALVGLFQITNMNRKMVLMNKLISVQMSRSGNVTNYFMRIT